MKRKHKAASTAQVPAPQPRREVARLSPDPEQGLTLHQVKERQQNGWANDPVDSPTKTVGQIVRENVFTFFNFIFVVLAALLVAVGSFDDMLFLLIAVANTGIGIVQQLRSKQTVDKLNLLAAPGPNVVREGNLISVPAAQLVRDDVAELASGDQIPADATVLSGQVQVNEALTSPARPTPSPRPPATSCSPAPSWCPAAAGPGWTGWGRSPTPPASPWRPRRMSPWARAR